MVGTAAANLVDFDDRVLNAVRVPATPLSLDANKIINARVQFNTTSWRTLEGKPLSHLLHGRECEGPMH